MRSTWLQHDTTTLELDSHRINHIKNRISELDENTVHLLPERRPSTFVAISALVWASVVQARSLDRGARAHLLFLADCRSRLQPPVDEAYFGNCVRGCVVEASAGDLLDAPHGVLHASKAIQKAIDEFVEKPLDEFDAWFDPIRGLLRQPGFVAVTASPRFGVYATDFGWGEPSRVEFVSEGAPEGMAVLTGGRTEASLQISACLNPVHMQAFKLQVLDF